MSPHSNYDKFPSVQIRPAASECELGWTAIASKLGAALKDGRSLLCVECYPGVREREVEQALAGSLGCGKIISTRDLLKRSADIDVMLAPYLGDDPVFGRMNAITWKIFLILQNLPPRAKPSNVMTVASC